MRFDQEPRISTTILRIEFQDTVFDDMPKEHRINATSVVGEEHEVKRRTVAIFGIQPREQRKPRGLARWVVAGVSTDFSAATKIW